MTDRTRHSRLVGALCGLHAALLWTYPESLRDEFGREMRITFRNQAIDAFRAPTLPAITLFVIRMAADWLRTVTLEPEDPPALSLLGLGPVGDRASGTLDRSNHTGSLLLAALGVALMIGGWYEWVAFTAQILRH